MRSAGDEDAAFILEHQDLIKTLARVGGVTAGADVAGPKASASNVVMGNELFVPLTGAVDFDAELARLDKEMAKVEKTLGGVEKKLGNPGFVNNAPRGRGRGREAEGRRVPREAGKARRPAQAPGRRRRVAAAGA